jgi:DNA-binding Xre family transcriptional regulator
MKKLMHPTIDVIKNEIHHRGLKYDDVAKKVAIPLVRIKNMMSGRTRLTIEEADAICNALGMTPCDVVFQRRDFEESHRFVDIRRLSPELREAIKLITTRLTQGDTTTP